MNIIKKNTNNTDVRQSNFELLRLVSMFYIVLYHLLFFFIVKVDDSALYKSLELFLHVGVICFVLISGYFHIRPSVRGAVKLLLPLIVFYLPLTLWEYIHGIVGVKSLFIFSKSPYWFIRTYFFLFLISPMINSFLTNNKHRYKLLAALGLVAVYMGTMHEPSLFNGKNLILFMFVYVLGDCLRALSSKYEKWKFRWLLLAYISLNVLLIVSYTCFYDNFLGKIIWKVSYPYCSPVLILNALLLFVVFSKLSFKSRTINYLSSSVLSIYILHHQHFVLYTLIGPIVYHIYDATGNQLVLFIGLCAFTILIMVACIAIDKLFKLTHLEQSLTQGVKRLCISISHNRH